VTLITLRRAAHASPVAVVLLVVANLIPLAGVLWLGWELTTLLALYWLENGVVGVFAALKIVTAEGIDLNPGTVTINGRVMPQAQLRDPRLARAIYLPFFVVHYGLFWLVHGLFVLVALPVMFASFGPAATEPTLGEVIGLYPVDALGGALLFLFASHGASFVLNWLWSGERATTSPAAQMAAPYGRVVVRHVTMVVGAFAVAALGEPIGALVVMVLLKTIADLAAHLAERGRADDRARSKGLTLARSAGRMSIG